MHWLICDGLGFGYKDAMFSEYLIEQFSPDGIDLYNLAAQRIRAILEFAKY